MTTFHYTARTRTGEKRSGAIEATDRSDAMRKLERMGLVPVSISDQARPSSVPQRAAAKGKRPWFAIVCACVIGVIMLITSASLYRASDTHKLAKARSLADAERYAHCIHYLDSTTFGSKHAASVSNLLFTCWMGEADRMYDAGRFQECREFILARPEAFHAHQPAVNLFLTCRASQALQAYNRKDYQTCLDIIAEVEQQASSLPQKFVNVRRSATDALIMPQFDRAKALLASRKYAECIQQLDSLPAEFSLTDAVASVKSQAERKMIDAQEREEAKRRREMEREQRAEARRREKEQKEQEVRSANANLWLDVKHVITKRVRLQGFFGEKERYRYFFDIRNRSSGFTFLKGQLSIQMYYQEKQPIGSTYKSLNVNPNQGMSLYIDSRISPLSLGGQGRFEYEFSVDGVDIRTGTGYFSSSYEDLTQ